MRAATMAWLIALTACGATTPLPEHDAAATSVAPPLVPVPVAPPAPAPTPEPAALPTSRLDALVDWVVEHDVDFLTVGDGEERDIGITAGGSSHACRGHQCFTVPFAESIIHFQGSQLDVVPRGQPALHANWSFAVRDGTAILQQRWRMARVGPLGARPPITQTVAHGRERLAALGPSVPSLLLGLEEAIAGLDDAFRIGAETLRAGDRRITVVTAETGQEDSEWIVLVRSPGVVARSAASRSAAVGIEEVIGDGLVAPFTLVRTSSQAGRGWSSDLWSVGTEDGRVVLSSVSLGGADGYGEGCERESDGYCVWLTGCERALVVDGPDRAHLGPPLAWLAEHRRLSDRWIYGQPADPPEGCPEESSLCVTARGLGRCEAGD